MTRPIDNGPPFLMPLPSIFYFTDDQRGADPLQIAQILAPGTGIIFRHYSSRNRADLAVLLQIICKKRNLSLYISKNPDLSAKVGAQGCHLPGHDISRLPLLKARYPKLSFTAACHSRRSLIAAAKIGADAAFLSPIYPTRSHWGEKTFGPLRAALLKQGINMPVYALGGVTEQNWCRLSSLGFSGFGAISAFEDQ